MARSPEPAARSPEPVARPASPAARPPEAAPRAAESPPPPDSPPPWGDDDEPPHPADDGPLWGGGGRGFDEPPPSFDGPRGRDGGSARGAPDEAFVPRPEVDVFARGGARSSDDAFRRGGSDISRGDDDASRRRPDDDPFRGPRAAERAAVAPTHASATAPRTTDLPPGPRASAPPAVEPLADPRFAELAQAVRKKRPILGGSLLQVRPLVFEPGRVVLGCDSSFDEQQLSQPDVLTFLAAEASALLGRATSVEVQRIAGVPGSEPRPATLTEVEDGYKAARRAERIITARESTAVQQVQDILGAKLARIKVVEED